MSHYKYLIIILLFLSITLNINNKIKIMCMGDSITFGSGMPGSYRKFLYNNLIKKGYKIKMVGAKDNKIEKYYNNENSSEFFEYEDDNSGFSAFTISQYGKRKGLLEILKKNKCLKLNPNIIILQIGTNNAMDNYNFDKTIKDFISLIDYMLNNISNNTIIFVATIPDMDPNVKKVYSWFKNYRKKKKKIKAKQVRINVNNYVAKFNNKIKEIIENYRNNNYNIRIGDLNPVIKDVDNLMFDGVHPNNEGYKKIADFWTDIVEKYINENLIKLNKLYI